MAKACLVYIVLFSFLFAIYYFLLDRFFELELIPKLIIAFFSALAMQISVGLFRKALDNRRQLAVLGKETSPGLLKDGEQISISGTIHSESQQPMKSPFTQMDCIFYEYEIFHWEQRGVGKSRSNQQITDRWGIHLIPASVRSIHGKIRLLAYPFMKDFPDIDLEEPTDAVLQNAMHYLQNTRFEKDLELNISNTYNRMKEIFTDADGSIHKDIQDTEKEPADQEALKEYGFEEKYIAEGEHVTLIGNWSAEKQGIVPGKFAESDADAILIRGTRDQAASSLKSSFQLNLIGSIFLFLLVNGIFWWIINAKN